MGIVVGIFAVTAMLALGEGLSTNILDRFNSFSTGDITVSGDLTQQDFAWVQDQTYVDDVIASQSLSGVETIAGGESFSPNVSTYIGDYEVVADPELVSGELFDFNDTELTDRIAVINEGFLEKVAEEAGVDVSAGSITLNGIRFSIVAVIEGGNTGFGRRSDGNIIIPYAAAIGTMTNTSGFSSLAVNLVQQEYYEIAAQHILESLNSARYVYKDSSDYFSVNSAQDAIENARETTQMLSLFLGLVGAITLFVGGIGTMNMMLTTVTERTKEIGLRKAIGARNKDILYQILVESVVLTLIGGAIGIMIAYGGSVLANKLLADNSTIKVIMSWRVVFLAVSVSILVGVVFGYYPARSAAKLQPADALRAD
jgi:putative ABC transport system permease protein